MRPVNFIRLEIYRICSQHNLLIFEDDPYWNLTFTDSSSSSVVFNFSHSCVCINISEELPGARCRPQSHSIRLIF
jgi:hypothetical protein